MVIIHSHIIIIHYYSFIIDVSKQCTGFLRVYIVYGLFKGNLIF